MEQGSVAQRAAAPNQPETESGCPVAGSRVPPETSGDCPFPAAKRGGRRSRADDVVRKLLRIRERPAGVSAKSAYSTFQRSMIISGIRCSLTYVIFPFVLPAVGLATGVGPIIGIVIGVIAMACDVYTIRRFFAIDHKWRWHFSAVALGVIVLLSVLLVQDISQVVR